MESDPSDGKCDAAPMSFGGPDKCRANVTISLESFIDQIECNYEDVVAAVAGNENPDLPYWDPEFPFADEARFVFPQDPDCNHGELGCFFDAELRAFCEITDETIQSSCEQAGNLPDPAADDDGGCGVDETGGGGGIVDPFGDIDNSVYCSPQTDCTILQQLHYDVGYNFHVFYDEGVELVPVSSPTRGVKVTGLNSGEYSKELADAFGIQNDDVITHVNGTQLANEANTFTVIAMLDADDGPWSVTVRRWNGSSWATLNYSIALAVSSPLKRGDNSPGLVAPQEGEPASTSSCACQTTGTGPAPAGLAVLLVGGLLGRRRRG